MVYRFIAKADNYWVKGTRVLFIICSCGNKLFAIEYHTCGYPNMAKLKCCNIYNSYFVTDPAILFVTRDLDQEIRKTNFEDLEAVDELDTKVMNYVMKKYIAGRG